MYRIFWKHKMTGKTGHGEPMSLELATSWIQQLNNDYQDILHWITPACKRRLCYEN
jgi:hypothetical protein